MPRNELPHAEAVSTAEAARILGVSDETVKRYFIEKKLDGFKLPGGHYRIFQSSIDRMTGR